MSPSSSEASAISTFANVSPSTSGTTATKASPLASKKKLNFSSLKAQSFVAIYCKDATEPFRIHKNVITHYSPFFSAAFNSEFKDGKSQCMTFVDIEVPIFGFFNNWLYTQQIVSEEGTRLQLIEYAKLWSLARRFFMPELQAVLLKELKKTSPSSDVGSGSTLKDFQEYVYLIADQRDDSDLKSLAIKKTLSFVNQNNFNEVMSDFPAGMLPDFTKALLEDRTKLRGWELGLGIEGVVRKTKAVESLVDSSDLTPQSKRYVSGAMLFKDRQQK